MIREHIKNKVYECVRKRFYDPKIFNNLISIYPDNGEDLLIYSEIGFDSLDVVEFILSLEETFKIVLPDYLFNSEVTLRIIIDYIYEQRKNI